MPRGAWGVGRGAWGVGRAACGVGRAAWGVCLQPDEHGPPPRQQSVELSRHHCLARSLARGIAALAAARLRELVGQRILLCARQQRHPGVVRLT